jgi:hypothetical protein
MADDTKGPLEASVGEQLQAKARLEEASGAERRDDELARGRVERRKAGEQATVLEHTGGEHRATALRPASTAGAAAGAGAGAPGADARSSTPPRDLLAAVRGLPPKGLAAIAGALLLLNGRRRRGRIARFLVPLGAASFVLALRRGWAPAALGAR